MKKILLLISIGLFAMFCAGCITEDAGTAAAENQSALPPQGREMPVNAPEDHTPPLGAMNGTLGSMEPDSIPHGEALRDQPDMNQTGIPLPVITMG